MKTMKVSRLMKHYDVYEGISIESEIRKAKEEQQPLNAGMAAVCQYEDIGDVKDEYNIKSNNLEMLQKARSEVFRMREQAKVKYADKNKAEIEKSGQSAPEGKTD